MSKNKPNDPVLWSRAKSWAKEKFDVYPSAYANLAAAKWYKKHGGTWRKSKEHMNETILPTFYEWLKNKEEL